MTSPSPACRWSPRSTICSVGATNRWCGSGPAGRVPGRGRGRGAGRARLVRGALGAPLDPPEAYLHRCVVNRSHDVLRRRRLELRFRRMHRDEHDELHADELRDALGRLPDRLRAVVVLRFYAGLPEREIANALNIRPGTVKSRLHRALAQLRLEIER